MNDKIKHITDKFTQLRGHEDLVRFVLDIREAFNLKKVPFELKVGTWSSGHLSKYYAHVERKRAEKRSKPIKRRTY